MRINHPQSHRLRSSRPRRFFLPWTMCLALLTIFLFVAPKASAELGGSVSSVQTDQERMKGSVRVMPSTAFTIHEIQTPSGTKVREFVSPAGTVFGVAWEGPWMPDLRQLLGPYFDQFVKAAQESKRRGRGPLSIEANGLVVQTGGHARSFFGRAYLLANMPQNVSVEDIK
jgi:uncharacterized protein DUF2844